MKSADYANKTDAANSAKAGLVPPAIGTIEKLRESLTGFNRFLIFYKVYALEDSFDWEGMMESVNDFQSRIFKLKKHIRKTDAAFDFLVLGAGACQVCDACTYPEQEPCRFPDDAMYSVESFGIDLESQPIDPLRGKDK